MEQDRDLGTDSRVSMGFLNVRSVVKSTAGEGWTSKRMSPGAECWACSLHPWPLFFNEEAGKVVRGKVVRGQRFLFVFREGK